MVLTTGDWLAGSTAMDVRLRTVAPASGRLRHNTTLTLHTGAAEVAARLRLLESEADAAGAPVEEIPPGAERWAQLRLEAPVGAARGDYFVLRNSVTTVGGGRIVDTRPRRHRRDEPATLAALSRLLEGSPDDTLLTVLQRIEPAPLSQLRARAELDDAATVGGGAAADRVGGDRGAGGGAGAGRRGHDALHGGGLRGAVGAGAGSGARVRRGAPAAAGHPARGAAQPAGAAGAGVRGARGAADGRRGVADGARGVARPGGARGDAGRRAGAGGRGAGGAAAGGGVAARERRRSRRSWRST